MRKKFVSTRIPVTPDATLSGTSTQNDARALGTARAGRQVSSLRGVLIALWVVVAAVALGYGWDYYSTPLAERAFATDHRLLAPTGRVGHSLGIAGSLMMIVGVLMYSVRKRVGALAGLGRMSHWLQVHIFLCTLGPFLVLLPTSFKFGGIVSIAFWSMTAVVLSGLFGRYVYVRIPKSIHGQFRSLQSIEHQRTELVALVVRHAQVDAGVVEHMLGQWQTAVPGGLFGALWSSLRYDLSRRSRATKLRAALRAWRVPEHLRARLLDLLQKQLEVTHQIHLLQPFQRLFRYWHVFHLPLAAVMMVILVVHVIVAAMFGYGWPR
jgi:hypothetical protein